MILEVVMHNNATVIQNDVKMMHRDTKMIQNDANSVGVHMGIRELVTWGEGG